MPAAGSGTSSSIPRKLLLHDSSSSSPVCSSCLSCLHQQSPPSPHSPLRAEGLQLLRCAAKGGVRHLSVDAQLPKLRPQLICTPHGGASARADLRDGGTRRGGSADVHALACTLQLQTGVRRKARQQANTNSSPSPSLPRQLDQRQHHHAQSNTPDPDVFQVSRQHHSKLAQLTLPQLASTTPEANATHVKWHKSKVAAGAKSSPSPSLPPA